MMKRTFFTVLLCFLLSFSIFTVDVYASSNEPIWCTTSRVGIAGVKYLRPSYTFVSVPSSNGSGVKLTQASAKVTYYDPISATFTPEDSSVSLTPGFYRFAFFVNYTLHLAPPTDLALPADFSITPRVENLPSGVEFFMWPYDYTFDADWNVSFSLYFWGTCFITSSGNSSSFPLYIDVVQEFTLPLSSLAKELPVGYVLTGSVSTSPLNRQPLYFLSTRDELGLLGDIGSSVDDVNDTIKQEHQEEIDKANSATSDVTSGVGQLTNTLSTWEIITMPFNLVKNFAQAIAGDGSSALTFPSFSMMGYQIWPSYTFDLQTVASSFPVLYNGLHLVSGTVVVTGFVRYLWRKWSLLVGDDMPEGSDTS